MFWSSSTQNNGLFVGVGEAPVECNQNESMRTRESQNYSVCAFLGRCSRVYLSTKGSTVIRVFRGNSFDQAIGGALKANQVEVSMSTKVSCNRNIPQDIAQFVMKFVDRVLGWLECVLGEISTRVNEDRTSVKGQNYHGVNHIGSDSVIGETVNVISSASETDSFVN